MLFGGIVNNTAFQLASVALAPAGRPSFGTLTHWSMPIFSLGAAALAIVALAQPSPPPDRIFINGRIWTGTAARPYAEALAVREDRLVAVGTTAEVQRRKGPTTVVTDLGRRLVVPGFIDSHWHFSPTDRADLDDGGSLAEIITRLRTHAASHPTGWIQGRGWAYNDFPNRTPDRRQLDSVFPDRPVVIWERDGHMVLVNSLALAKVGVDRTTQDPPNGRIERDRAGELTGEFKESAMDLVTRLLPEPTPDEADLALQRIMTRAASFGLTSVHLVNGLSPAEMTAFERNLARKSFAVRFYVAVPFTEGATDSTLAGYLKLKEKYRGPFLKFGAAKGMLDGTVDAKTAAMLKPYVGAGTDAGIPMWRQEALNRAVAQYDRAGLQIMLHAIGDQAIRMALDAYQAAARTNHSSGRRHRIEHLEVPDPADLPRFKRLGVIASTQAMFAYPDATTLGNYAGLLGPARASRANAFKKLDDAGAIQAFGSDFPVFTMEVLKGINTAVNRTTVAGTPSGGWYPENRVSVATALKHFTRDGAFASFEESDKGTLETGKLADFVVLSKDILAEPPARLMDAKVLLTVMGGRETYRADSAVWAIP